ncbi:uncharacterized protein ASCRUDRAFT_76975 [Ascoidea rubescens DSM 1968]|uniref:GRIP domain-containing protein n=1 Tax=Ascoidea rubescens DSM 1968 TaxID=1344418 RepID=A0A1D2VDP7_9ASCO|nr:hypothetical protein ASCRUDRAFT_76975 [Ascoidea rubescens DSM 1968]ODV59613.1 hypothetical protein ASCRUDRAFT_76975 [Ascoidea rubescens DSM 1968]
MVNKEKEVVDQQKIDSINDDNSTASDHKNVSDEYTDTDSKTSDPTNLHNNNEELVNCSIDQQTHIKDINSVKTTVSEFNNTKNTDNNDSITPKDQIDTNIAKLTARVNDLDLKLKEKNAIIEELRLKDISDSSNLNVNKNKNHYEVIIDELNNKLEHSQSEKSKYESQYNALLNKLSGMKSVFQKMKTSQNDITLMNEKILTLNEQISGLKNDNILAQKENNDLKKQLNSMKFENDGVVSALNSKMSDLNKDLTKKTITINNLNNSIQDYLILIDENKILVNTLNNQIVTLKNLNEEKAVQINLINQEKNELLQKYSINLDNLNNKILQFSDKNEELLQKNNKLVQNHKELVFVIESLKNQLLEKDLEITKLIKFEKEIKEKQLIIGKLRHEAIILNEHLTKTFKKIQNIESNENSSVDKELISNLILKFLSIQRGDAKKFEVLKLISSYLNWDKNQQIQAGLIHGNIVPSSPFRKRNFSNATTTNSNSSAYSLNSHSPTNISGMENSYNYNNDNDSTPKRSFSGMLLNDSKESFASLWTEFLEKESSTKK